MELGPGVGGSASTGPTSAKKAGMAVLAILVLGLAYRWWSRPEADPSLSGILDDLGDTPTEMARLRRELGAPATNPARGPALDLDAPIDLASAGRPADRGPEPTVSSDPSPSPTRLDRALPTSSGTEPATPPSTPGAAGYPTAPESPSGRPGGRLPVDPAMLHRARRAGDIETLYATLVDEELETPGRVLASALASDLQDPRLDTAFYEILESRDEPDGLRESAAVALAIRQPRAFAGYLARVAARPSVAEGKDRELERLVLLAFYADSEAGEGSLVTNALEPFTALARQGNRVALQALSFALRRPDASRLDPGIFDKETASLVVRDNLVRHLRQAVEAGRSELAPRLRELERM